jgi:hypothetical protein
LVSIGWTSDAPDLVEAMILMASIHVGPNEAVIAQMLGFPSEYVSTVGSTVGIRLREGGIWVGDHVAHAGRWAECLITFRMDVMVASGEFKCTHGMAHSNSRVTVVRIKGGYHTHSALGFR